MSHLRSTLPSSLLRTHASDLKAPIDFALLLQQVFAGCRHSLLPVGPSRRYLCESFSTCKNPYSGCSCAALRHPDCSHRDSFVRQPWLLLPRISQFVTSPSRGYANRLNRAIGGRGTFTLLDSQPCRCSGVSSIIRLPGTSKLPNPGGCRLPAGSNSKNSSTRPLALRIRPVGSYWNTVLPLCLS
jgi:hypothetical protein